MKVHVILERSAASDRVVRRLVFHRAVVAGRIRPENPARFDRHGILTGEMPLDRIELVRAVRGVEAVEVDEEEVTARRGQRCGDPHK